MNLLSFTVSLMLSPPAFKYLLETSNYFNPSLIRGLRRASLPYLPCLQSRKKLTMQSMAVPLMMCGESSPGSRPLCWVSCAAQQHFSCQDINFTCTTLYY